MKFVFLLLFLAPFLSISQHQLIGYPYEIVKGYLESQGSKVTADTNYNKVPYLLIHENSEITSFYFDSENICNGIIIQPDNDEILYYRIVLYNTEKGYIKVADGVWKTIDSKGRIITIQYLVKDNTKYFSLIPTIN